jgi:hypothetical protein
MVLVTARFMARRNITRFSNCCEMPSATSFASSSGLRISAMLNLDMNVAHRRIGQLLVQKPADQEVGMDVRSKILRVRIPLGRPVAGYPQANANRIYFLNH